MHRLWTLWLPSRPHLPFGKPPCQVRQVGEGVSPTLDALEILALASRIANDAGQTDDGAPPAIFYVRPTFFVGVTSPCCLSTSPPRAESSAWAAGAGSRDWRSAAVLPSRTERPRQGVPPSASGLPSSSRVPSSITHDAVLVLRTDAEVLDSFVACPATSPLRENHLAESAMDRQVGEASASS